MAKVVRFVSATGVTGGDAGTEVIPFDSRRGLGRDCVGYGLWAMGVGVGHGPCGLLSARATSSYIHPSPNTTAMTPASHH